MYKLHTHCRACGYGRHAPGTKSANEPLTDILDLGIQPLANDFCKDGEWHSGYAPLKMVWCPRCTLAQLSVVVDPSVLYRHYSYVTSPSVTMREHFKKLMLAIAEESPHGKSVLEIGSNDGRLLGLMQENNYTVQGIDPAENLVAIANADAIPTKLGFFDKSIAATLPNADIIIARHVFCHIDDWCEFVEALELVSHRDTLVVIEVPYAGDTLKNCEFDQCYHEHLSFLTYRAMDSLLAKSSFEIVNILRFPIHGGTSVLMLRKRGLDFPNKKVVRELIEGENLDIGSWTQFATEARDQINRLTTTVKSLRKQGKRVVGLGASAKSTVWISACGFTRKDIEFIADNTEQKQLTTSPGTDIPIVDEGAIIRELPDYAIMFAWNYQQEILEKFAKSRQKGLKFIVPVKTIAIV